MSTLLRIDSSPLYSQSVSRELTCAFVDQWTLAFPGGRVINRDLNTTVMAPISGEFVTAMYTPDEARTVRQNEVLSLSDSLVDELQEANEYVFGVPMHNFGVPSALKLWVDHIARRGRTFAYVDGKANGLLVGKKATFIIATGGIYDPLTQMASFNFVEPYLRSLFTFLGVIDLTFMTTGGTKVLSFGQDRAMFLKPHIQAVQDSIQNAQKAGERRSKSSS